MTRYDIIADLTYGDLDLSKSYAGKVVADFDWLGRLDGYDNDHFIYAEVTLPRSTGLSYTDKDSLVVKIPYLAEFKKMKIRFLIDSSNEDKHQYLINPKDNSVWYGVNYTTGDPAIVSEISSINHKDVFEIVFSEGMLVLYDGESSDLKISESLNQNKNLLLQARMGNIIRFPLTGVGLVDFLNSNLNHSDLAEKLQSEFVKDGMVVVEASINAESGDLKLTVEE